MMRREAEEAAEAVQRRIADTELQIWLHATDNARHEADTIRHEVLPRHATTPCTHVRAHTTHMHAHSPDVGVECRRRRYAMRRWRKRRRYSGRPQRPAYLQTFCYENLYVVIARCCELSDMWGYFKGEFAAASQRGGGKTNAEAGGGNGSHGNDQAAGRERSSIQPC